MAGSLIQADGKIHRFVPVLEHEIRMNCSAVCNSQHFNTFLLEHQIQTQCSN